MATHFISESRIRSQRFYTVMRESKIRFYTTSVAAARYWIKNCSDSPPLAQDTTQANGSAEAPGAAASQSKPADDAGSAAKV